MQTQMSRNASTNAEKCKHKRYRCKVWTPKNQWTHIIYIAYMCVSGGINVK